MGRRLGDETRETEDQISSLTLLRCSLFHEAKTAKRRVLGINLHMETEQSGEFSGYRPSAIALVVSQDAGRDDPTSKWERFSPTSLPFPVSRIPKFSYVLVRHLPRAKEAREPSSNISSGLILTGRIYPRIRRSYTITGTAEVYNRGSASGNTTRSCGGQESGVAMRSLGDKCATRFVASTLGREGKFSERDAIRSGILE